MKLPNLSQTVELARGEARLVHQAGREVLEDMLRKDPTAGQRLSVPEALALKPLANLLKKLSKLAEREEAAPVPARGRKASTAKKKRVKTEFDELATVRMLYGRLLNTQKEPSHQLVLATALAAFHQRSLNVESHLRLPAPGGPGAQWAFA